LVGRVIRPNPMVATQTEARKATDQAPDQAPDQDLDQAPDQAPVMGQGIQEMTNPWAMLGRRVIIKQVDLVIPIVEAPALTVEETRTAKVVRVIAATVDD